MTLWQRDWREWPHALRKALGLCNVTITITRYPKGLVMMHPGPHRTQTGTPWTRLTT